MAGHGSPNSPELISMLQDWLPSHLGSSIVKVVKVVKDEDDDQDENDDHDQEVGEVSRSQYLMWIGNELSGAVKRISELSCLSFIPPRLYPLTGS